MILDYLFNKKKKEETIPENTKKKIFFNFKVLERQSKIRRLFKIPLSPLTFRKEYWF